MVPSFFRRFVCHTILVAVAAFTSSAMDVVDLTSGKPALESGKKGENIVSSFKPIQQDLSAFESVEITLKNHGKTDVLVVGEVGNASNKGSQDRCQGRLELAAGETGILKVRLMWRPTAPNYKKEFEPFFMFFKGMNVRDNTLDPTKVSFVRISYDAVSDADKVEIQKVVAKGEREGKQPNFFPFVDEYGQYMHIDWPGKVYNDADLKAQAAASTGDDYIDGSPSDWNEYGGWEKGPQLKATGFFYAKIHEGKWWLVDPKGRLFWSYGPTGVGFHASGPITDKEKWFADLPAKDGEFGEFYGTNSKARFKYYHKRDNYETFSYVHTNLKRMYGENWRVDANQGIHKKLRSWGINTCAAWSDNKVYEMKKTPYITMIHFSGPWITHEHFFRMPDPFDEGFRLAVRKSLESKPLTANDPWNIGYCVNNELGWGAESFGLNSALATLGKAWGKPKAKQVFVADLEAKYKDIQKLNRKWGSNYKSWEDMLEKRQMPNKKRAMVDLQAFAEKLAHEYFRIIREEVKRFAPNNMYLGCRFHGHRANDLIAVAMEYVDVVSYNIYQNPPNRGYQYKELFDKKPFMVTEFGVGTNPEQSPWRGDNRSPNPADRSNDLTKYLKEILKNPQFVGAHFFQFLDQPLTGRNDGEALLRGFVDVVGKPNFRLIEVNRDIVFPMYKDRFDYELPKEPSAGVYNLDDVEEETGTELIGVHGFREEGPFITKKYGWAKDADSQAYSWGNSTEFWFDKSKKVKGEGSYRFIVKKGWSRWILQMNDKKTLDFSPYQKLKFSLRSTRTKKWKDFSVIMEDTEKNYTVIRLADLGFKPDGKFHEISIDINALKKSGVNISKLNIILQFSWGGGVRNGDYFHMDNLHLVK
ncbi:MAG: beta-galactosidase [Lentisphaeria bacterium]|nr:beta-galactosidase [Lentisphaeria bacterium]